MLVSTVLLLAVQRHGRGAKHFEGVWGIDDSSF